MLLVDDNEPDRVYCKIMLEEAGGFLEVIEATAGDEALQLFLDYEQSRIKFPGAFPPTIVFLDINMPRMDGFEFLEAYQQTYKALEYVKEHPSIILMVTSSSLEQDMARAKAFPFVKGYLVKPISVEDAESIRDTYGARL